MKLLFIYDSSELKDTGRIINSISAFDHIHVLTVNEKGKKRSLYDVAIDLKKKIPENESCIIFIDQYLTCADEGFEWLQRNTGIALIKFLRMMEVRSHIVLITPFEKSQLIEKPSNFIISSKDISVRHYLHEMQEMTEKQLHENFSQTFEETKALRAYILAEFQLPEDERHNWANWWGIDRLWNVHRAVEKEKFGLGERWDLKEYSGKLKNKLKELRNREALFLYGHQENFIVNNLAELNEEVSKLSETLRRYISAKNSFIENQNIIETGKNNKTTEINFLELQISNVSNLLPQLNGLSEFFLKMRGENIRRLVELSGQIRELEEKLREEKKRISQVSNSISDKENKLDELISLLNEEEAKYLSELKRGIDKLESEIQKLQSKILSLSIPALRKKLQEKAPIILYIDDQADEGWSDIFQHIIYNEEQQLFKVIQPKGTDKINRQYFVDIVCPEIIIHKPDLILLDLRLNKETGISIEVEKLSGATLLKEIRNHFPGIPVLMTTASNKSWSYEELQRIGCDAFWTKEGIDTGMAVIDSIKNYIRFAELVNILTDYDYKFLSVFATEIMFIRNNKMSWWWENSQYGYKGKVNREDVVTILNHTIFIVREYLKNEVINPYRDEQQTNWLLPSLIIHNLGKIPELIYNTWNIDKMFDKHAQELYWLRNNASHIVQSEGKKIAKDFTFFDAKEQCRKIVAYLQLKKKPDVIEFNPVSDSNLTVSREQLMKNIEDSKRNRKR